MPYNPYSRIDNNYYQPWKVGDVVYDWLGNKHTIIEVDSYFNRRDRRNSCKFYWTKPGFGHGMYADEFYHTRELALKSVRLEDLLGLKKRRAEIRFG